jgi:chromosome segregation ATPase
MDYRLSGNMRTNAIEPNLQIGSAIEASRKTDIDDSQIRMLELEIEDLSSELEKERKKASIERIECTKHLQELEDAELELLHCQTALRGGESKLAEVQIEIRGKNDELLDAKEELVQRSRRVRELEQQIEQIPERNQEGILDTH